MALQPHDFVIDDSNFTIAGKPPKGRGRGQVPRDYSVHPVGFYAPPLQIPLIPRNEWPERIRDMDANKSRVSDVRRRSGPNGGHIPALNQGSEGFCWSYSCAGVVMLVRAIMNQPYVRLSAHHPACIIKNYRNEGGWCGLSLAFFMEHGCASTEVWPEQSMSRSNDTQAMRDNAKLHVVTYTWADMAASVYNRNFSEDQAMTLLLTRTPIQGDFNHWSHSVTLMDPVLVNESMASTDFGSLDLDNEKDAAVYAAAFGKRLLNSWSDQWGDLGEGVLTGSKAILDGGVCALVTGASIA